MKFDKTEKIIIPREGYKRNKRLFYDENEQLIGKPRPTEKQPEEQEKQTVEKPQKQPSVKKSKPNKNVPKWLYLLIPLLGLLLIGALLWSLSNPTSTDEQPKEQTEKTTTTEEPSNNVKQSSDDLEEAIQHASKSVVSVINVEKQQETFGDEAKSAPQANPEKAGVGSGVIYKKDEHHAFIVTNRHVIQGAENLEVTLSNGKRHKATLKGQDEWTDLAVLTIDANAIDSTIKMRNSDEINVGETAIAIGSPLGQAFQGSVSRGIVSGLNRTVPVDTNNDGSDDWEANVLQTDAAINPGNSGGALIDESGKLIGISSMKISMDNVEGMNFAIPSNEVQKVVEQLEENGKLDRMYLGVMSSDLSHIPEGTLREVLKLPEDLREGVLVSYVEESSHASRVGLKTKDVITALNDEPMKSVLQFKKYLYYEANPNDKLAITYYRDGKKNTVTIDPTEDE
ncbi:S1C family serine protease [Abyssicoccus albus]|uniref:S1C family serine protease n=1 Tax=Abyssicoccus albus TaxID=1817405 RepID=UPI0013723244|nr:trypsin-like peptidase domain-containing protein [Abyssicoccus albus]